MKDLENYKVIFWDFDGVIMDSMPLRDRGFIEVLKDFPDYQVKELLEYHRKNGGLSRYVKFRYFYENILNGDISEMEVNKLAQQFSIIMKRILTDPTLLIQDSLNFIKNNYKQYTMHIVSGSDGNELRYLCDKLEISKYFLSIDGSPTPKSTLVSDVLKKFNYDKNDCVLIGDSKNDFEAAVYNSLDFMGYNNTSLKFMGKRYLECFT